MRSNNKKPARQKAARTIAPACLCAALLTGCVALNAPQNDAAQLYAPEQTGTDPEKRRNRHKSHGKLSYLSNACAPAGTPNFLVNTMPRTKRKLAAPPMRYSPGDRFNVLIFDQPEFSGDYAVNIDGTAILPFAGPIRASGLTNAQLTHRIKRTMVRRGLFTAAASQISVHPVQYAPVNVTVSGAVFSPGRHTINIIKSKDKIELRKTKTGDSPLDRFVPAAIRAAGGVRPDADVSMIVVRRNKKTYRLNWRGAFTGDPVDDMPLVEGDHVKIGEAGCFQSALVRPSQITPPGIKVFLSNLTAPALSNSSSTRNPATSTGVPYGTRLLQGLVQANCVGGTYATNARRYAVLISRNPKTGKTEVIQRAVEDLVRRSDRDTINPFLMPGDAIACYDSKATEFRDVMSTLYSAVPPIAN